MKAFSYFPFFLLNQQSIERKWLPYVLLRRYFRSKKLKQVWFFPHLVVPLRLRREGTHAWENKLKQVLFGFPLT